MESSRGSSHVHRRSEIAEFVEARGGARIDELADQFGVSTMTIHRDLDHLHAQGMLRKVRSGAEAPPSEAFERNIDLRKALNLAEKQAVAKASFAWAAERVDMQAVAMDDSTTALHLLPTLFGHLPLTVVTNFLPAINELSPIRGCDSTPSAATTCRSSRRSSDRSRCGLCATCTTTSCSCRFPPSPAGCASTRPAPPRTSSARSWRAPSCAC